MAKVLIFLVLTYFKETLQVYLYLYLSLVSFSWLFPDAISSVSLEDYLSLCYYVLENLLITLKFNNCDQEQYFYAMWFSLTSRCNFL